MKKLLIKAVTGTMLTSVLTSTSVYAHDACNASLEAGFSLNKIGLEFLDEHDNTLYKITDDRTLIVDGQSVDLSPYQQVLVRDYSTSIRAMVPQVKTIAIEGVNLAFNALLGEGNELGSQLTDELFNIRKEISDRFSVNQGFTIGSNGFEGGDYLGDEFESRIERVVEQTLMNSMGSLLVAMGKEMILSAGDTKTFEKRMEKLGDNLAQQMEVRAEKLEHQAEDLCLAAVRIDQVEERLKIRIDELSNFDVISTKNHHQYNHSDKNNELM